MFIMTEGQSWEFRLPHFTQGELSPENSVIAPESTV